MDNNINQQVKLITINQLHDSLMTFNKNSIELKKLCVGLITGLPAILFKIEGNAIKSEYAIILLIMVIGFLVLDSHYHYNQKKIRTAMNAIKTELSEGSEGIAVENLKWYKSVFNVSNVLYFFLALVCGYYIWCLK